MHFYTAQDWTCQDWTRADLPFSHCALRGKMESTNTGIFLFFKWRCWKPFTFCTRAKMKPFEMLHGSQGRRPPTLTVGEERARGCSAADLGILWLWKAPRAQGMKDCHCEKPQGMGENQLPGACSAHLQARSHEEVNCSHSGCPGGRWGCESLVGNNNSTAGQEFLDKAPNHPTRT